MNNKIFTLLIGFFILLFWSACSDDDEVSSPVTANFTNQQIGISPSSSSAELEITFSRSVESGGTLLLTISSANLVYGPNADFYTTPEAVNNIISLPYEAGDESVRLNIHTGASLNITQDEEITISFQNDNDGVLIGTNETIKVTFSENFVAPSGTIKLNAGGADFIKQAFVDLSKLKQTTVDIYGWDLGFYNATGEHYVMLNSGAFTMARPVEKYDLNAVTAQDTISFGHEMQIPPPNYDPSIGAIHWVDAPDGNLENSAFGAIAPTSSESKVFIIKRDGDRSWKKVRVYQNGDNYILEYADISANSFETAEIHKDELYNFTFFDLDRGTVTIEPEKASWDFMYGTFTESLNLGGPGMDIPYGYKDFVIINRHSTKVAMVMKEDVSYEDFSTAHLAKVDFNTAIDALGENWRNGGGPSSGPALYDDRFFVLEDSEGIFYKLKFTTLTSTTGERGYPEFTFENVL